MRGVKAKGQGGSEVRVVSGVPRAHHVLRRPGGIDAPPSVDPASQRTGWFCIKITYDSQHLGFSMARGGTSADAMVRG
jgi:hypothetical protein